MATAWLMTGAAALMLSAVQVLPLLLDRLQGAIRRRWLSASGGAAVAFVLLGLLPELELQRDALEVAGVTLVPGVFELALVGLVAYYGVELLSRRRRARQGRKGSSWMDHAAIAMFAVYFAVIGRLTWSEQEEGAASLALYTVVMAVHVLAVDFGLLQHHRNAYRRNGRWTLAGAVLAGWLASGLVSIPPVVDAVVLSILAGAVMLVALKEELPMERCGHFGWFLAGAGAFAVLLQFT